MNKKIWWALAALVIAYPAYPWLIGKVAEKRMAAGLAKILEEAPYLTVAENKWQRGWLRSEQDVTFEIRGPWALGAPARFTLRNEILHGPVLGFSGIGVARIDTRIVLNDDLRKKLQETLGTGDPVAISTRLGLFGGGVTSVSSPAMRFEPTDGGTIEWSAMQLEMGFARGGNSGDVDGEMERVAFSGENNESMVFSELEVHGEAERVSEEMRDLWTGEIEFSFDHFDAVEADGQKISIGDTRYVVASRKEGDFMTISARTGVEDFVSKQITLEEFHYDFTVQRLHAETLQQVMSGIRASYVDPDATVDVAEHARKLLAYDPELVIDRVSVATAEGKGMISGIARLEGATADDLRMGGIGLLPKLEADIDVRVDVSMLEKLGGVAVVGMVEESGYFVRDGKTLTAKIEVRNGVLKVNGKSKGDVPGMDRPAAVEPQEEAELPEE